MQFLLTLLLAPIVQMVLAVIVAVPTWLLWNWIIPGLLGLPEVSLLQTLGLLMLTGLLFHRCTIEVNRQ